MTSSSIEQLLTQANPVADAEQMRLASDDMNSRCASILERRDAMTAPSASSERFVRIPAKRSRFRSTLAFAVGLVAALAAIGSVVLWAGGGDTAIEDPVATTAPPTTAPPTPTTLQSVEDQFTVLAYEDVPSFTGTVEYYQRGTGSGEPGWQASVAIRHAAPAAFEVTVVAESGEFLFLSGPGTVFFGDGTDVWFSEAGYVGPLKLEFEPFRHLFFDGEDGVSAWDDICGPTPTKLGVDTIAGRVATHVACSSPLEDYDLWVDEESGIVLKMIGPLGPSDSRPYLDRDGWFEFTEIVFEPVSTPSAPAAGYVAAEGSAPPLHMIRTETYGDDWRVIETWYLNGRTLRETIIDAADPAVIGTFTFAMNGESGACFRNEQFCESEALEENAVYELAAFSARVPQELVASSCTEAAQDSIAGRPARHFICDGVRFDFADGWRTGADPAEGTTEYWYDTATQLSLKGLYRTWSSETTLLEINPDFPVGIFEYDESQYADGAGAIAAGAVAPSWNGPMLDGTTFDMDGYADKHVVLFNWLPGCGDVCLEALGEFQRLSATYGSEEVVFVTVSEDVVVETQRVMDRFEITVPTVNCGWDPDQACFPESPWFLWGNPLPSVTVLGPDAIVLGVFVQPPIDADLEQLLDELSGDD